jgi:putative phage-type endonuclease
VSVAPTFGRAEWLQWRQSGIGGSDAPVIAGRSPWRSRLQLWMEKTGKTPPGDSVQAPHQTWGHLLEGPVAARYQARTERSFSGSQVCMQSKEYPWQLATVDRVTTDGRLVEIKAVSSHRKIATLGEDGDVDSLPDEWVLQCQHQMAVADAEVADMAVYVGMHEDIRLYEIPRNQPLIDALTEIEKEFWECVKNKVQPDSLDPRDADLIAMLAGNTEKHVALSEEVASEASLYTKTCEEIAALQVLKDQYRANLLWAMEGASYGDLPDGRILKVNVIDYPERISKPTKAYQSVRLTIKEPRK